jgi:hypothetical protein
MIATKHDAYFKCNPPVIKCALLILVVFLLSGCSTVNHGSLERSRDIAQTFETYHIFPSHCYYYLNQENNPFAIIALQSGYTICDPVWTEFDPHSRLLEKIVDLVKGFPIRTSI